MSNSYNSFSYVYDQFMDNIPYEEWSTYLIQLLQQLNVPNGHLVELGCGTCTMALLLANQGYTITGIDNSIDMLNIASQKTMNSPAIELQLQDMQDFILPCKVDSIYSICDSMNYLLTTTDIYDTFCCAKNHLKPGAPFIFDLKTIHYYRDILGDQIFCDHQENCSYTWENNYFAEDDVNQYDLTIFVRQPKTNLFEKYNETHHQRGYHLEVIIDLMTQAGLEYVTSYDAFSFNSPTDESERIYIIARNGDKS